MRYEEIKTKPAGEFKRLTGVSPQMFEKMLAVVCREWRAFGRPPKLSRADQVLMRLLYWREYRTQLALGADFGVSESTVSRTINNVEELLIQSGDFSLPGKKALHQADAKMQVIVVDATEQEIERPKKKQKKHYSGKQRRHTQKAQVIINLDTLAVISTAFSSGRCHDFRLFKEHYAGMDAALTCLADSGYQGIDKWHANSQTPTKRSKKQPLTADQKAANRALAKRRIKAEHVIRRLKIFRILKERYRNRRRRFGLRFNLIAAIYNQSLAPS